MRHQQNEKRKLADLQQEILDAENRIREQCGRIRLLQARRQDASEQTEVLRIMVAALVALRRRRDEAQAYLAFMDRLIDVG